MTWRPRIVDEHATPPDFARVGELRSAPSRSTTTPPGWYEKYAAGCAAGRERQEERHQRSLERARLLGQTQRIRVERARRVRDLLDLYVWWDGPGSEGRIA